MAPPRRRQPEALRQSLLDHAIAIAATKGLAALSLQAVAEAAGVSKGGLFHHFSSKIALIEAMVAELIARLDAEVDAALALAPQGRGCFTRAYLHAALDGQTPGLASGWPVLSMALLAEPALQQQWNLWIEQRLIRHAETDTGEDLVLIRYAADGLWLARASGLRQGTEDDAGLLARLHGAIAALAGELPPGA